MTTSLARSRRLRQLEDDTKAKLKRLARQHGRSTEEEAREILRNAVRNVDDRPARLGSRIAARFKGVGLTEDIPELRGQPVQPAQFTES
ncbi:FitA-like ribbon-helix-helix domain-containing protein [Mycolicibacterium chlorophenolicum]|uniref:FitA-like ribbon-helix-helix domain-containing protein n=1 Tax=Mycolicibacterium chlorophenolicum TaxID=37916 RepID=UPI0009E4E461